MNLNDIVGKRIVSTSCELGSVMGTLVWAAQMTFDDGTVLDIGISGRYDDAWLEFTFTEGPGTKAELNGLG